MFHLVQCYGFHFLLSIFFCVVFVNTVGIIKVTDVVWCDACSLVKLHARTVRGVSVASLIAVLDSLISRRSSFTLLHLCSHHLHFSIPLSLFLLPYIHFQFKTSHILRERGLVKNYYSLAPSLVSNELRYDPCFLLFLTS